MASARNLVGLIFIPASLSLMMACGTPRPPLPPSLELPKPVTDLRGARKGDTVSLVWTVPAKTTDGTNLHHLGPALVCRSLQVAINRCDPVGTLQPADLPSPQPVQRKNPSQNKIAKDKKPPTTLVEATFNDNLPEMLEEKNPTGFITYAIETQNSNLRSAGLSNQIQIPLAPVLPPPTDLHAKLTADGIVLAWTGILPATQVPGLSYVYRVYRRDKSSKTASIAGELPVSISAQPQFLDSGFQWQKTYDYWIAVVTMAGQSDKNLLLVEGKNSPPQTVSANDTFAPAAPVGLQAVASGVGQKPFVDLTWAPNTEPDLAGYNVYRREGNGDWNKLNDQPLKTPTYRDSTVLTPKTYSFSVSAVDARGNESPRSEEAAETLP
jgi:hypothetical protein